MLRRHADKRIMPNIWMAPGGHREFNEGLFECAKREVLEETGLRIKNIRVKAHGNAYLKDIDQEFHFHMLVADYAGGRLKGNKDDGEFVWLFPEEIFKLDNLLPELKEVLPHILSEDQKVISYKAVYDYGNHMSEFTLEKA